MDTLQPGQEIGGVHRVTLSRLCRVHRLTIPLPYPFSFFASGHPILAYTLPVETSQCPTDYGNDFS